MRADQACTRVPRGVEAGEKDRSPHERLRYAGLAMSSGPACRKSSCGLQQRRSAGVPRHRLTISETSNLYSIRFEIKDRSAFTEIGWHGFMIDGRQG